MSKKNIILITLSLVVAGVAVSAAYQRWQLKQGARTAPPPGVALEIEKMAMAADLPTGFMVWSSNRFGNHDILRMDLPGREVTRLTSHPHTEYYPRISPDGSKIVFSRSQKPWVSQRNTEPWDVVLLDIQSGEERVLAKNGNTPTWSADGKKVYFQNNVVNFTEVDVETGEQKVLFSSGRGEVKQGVVLYTPNYNAKTGKLAVTQHIGDYMATIVDMNGTIQKIGYGCQINWNRNGDILYHVGRGGKQKNAFYRYDARSGNYSKWLDLPGEFSHEYFPKLSNNEKYLVFAASKSGHEHDTADYEIFLWQVGTPATSAARLTYHTGNDNWPDIYLRDSGLSLLQHDKPGPTMAGR